MKKNTVKMSVLNLVPRGKSSQKTPVLIHASPRKLDAPPNVEKVMSRTRTSACSTVSLVRKKSTLKKVLVE